MTKTQLLSTIVGIFTFALVLSACSNQATTEATPTAAPTQAVETVEATPMVTGAATPATEGSTEAEGKTITDTAEYTSPGGEETIKFTIVVDDAGVITEAKAEPQGTNPTTKIRQTAFANEVNAAVKGKKLADLTTVARVGGSSLTTKAFNGFITEAKTQL